MKNMRIIIITMCLGTVYIAKALERTQKVLSAPSALSKRPCTRSVSKASSVPLVLSKGVCKSKTNRSIPKVSSAPSALGNGLMKSGVPCGVVSGSYSKGVKIPVLKRRNALTPETIAEETKRLEAIRVAVAAVDSSKKYNFCSDDEATQSL